MTCLILSFFLPITSYGYRKTRVIIDPGHGGMDQGAVWYGVREADLNLKVAKKLEKILRANKVSVTMTRRSNVFVSLPKRAAIANRYSNAIFVSIHFNAHSLRSVTGVETFYASPRGRRIAQNVQRKIVRNVKVRNRAIKRRLDFAVLNKTKVPAILVECGFISNYNERRRCVTGWYQNLVARGIAAGILKSIK